MYVYMFSAITATFIGVLRVFVLYIVAFGLTFYVLMQNQVRPSTSTSTKRAWLSTCVQGVGPGIGIANLWSIEGAIKFAPREIKGYWFEYSRVTTFFSSHVVPESCSSQV